MQFETCSEKDFLLLAVHTVFELLVQGDFFNLCFVISSLTDTTPLQKIKALVVEAIQRPREYPNLTLKLGMLRPGLKDTTVCKSMQTSHIFIYKTYTHVSMKETN